MKLTAHPGAAHVEYFDSVRRRLLDIPWKPRQEMLTDLLGRLDDLPARVDPGTVLGDSESYARLMREAAGYGPTAPRRFAYIRAWRLRRKILVAVAIVLAVTVLPATILAVRWRDRYQPLEASLSSGGSTAPAIDANIPTDTQYWKYRQGAEVYIGAMLTNDGRATVTVTGYVVPTDPSEPIQPTGLRLTRDAINAGEWNRAAPVDHFSVKPGERVVVFVMMKMVPWGLGEGVSVWQNLPTLRVEVLGRRHLLPIVGDKIGVVRQSP